MNITRVEVIDPRRDGRFCDPFVNIYVDEAILQGDRPVEHDRWRVEDCGPFVAVEYANGWRGQVAYDWTDVIDLGEFNKTGLHRRQLAQVNVFTPEDTLELQMQVPRLRRLLRKETGIGFSGWKCIVDEEAALLGLLKWRFEVGDPLCFSRDCTKNAPYVIFYNGTHLPFCLTHKRRQESKIAADNIKRNSTRQGA